MSFWLRSPLLQKTRTVLHGNVLNTLYSYSLGGEMTLGWAGGMKTLGRAARFFSQCEPSPHAQSLLPFYSFPSSC